MKKRSIIATILAISFAFGFTACDLSGETGKSAYEIAVENGFKGTEQEWLMSLKVGKSAYEIAVENGFKGTEKEWLESLKGSDGQNGDDGNHLTISDIYEEWLAQGNQGSFNDFLKEYLSVDSDGTFEYDVDILQHNLMSTVRIYCAFSNDSSSYSAGSGVIIDLDKEQGDAIVITNYHVVYNVESKEKISNDICLYIYGSLTGLDDDGSIGGPHGIHATYVGGAMNYDIAVLRVDNSEILKNSIAEEAKMGDSETVTVGEKVFAIGNAQGEGISVTEGILSVESETIDLTSPDEKSVLNFRVMRTTAAINHGNSGGPLFNAKGELIGINNAKRVEESVEGMGFSLPISQVKHVVGNILDNNGTVKRALFGVTIQTVDSKAVWDETRDRVKIVETLIVSDISTGSIAFGKFQLNDQIIGMEIGGEKITVERSFHMIDRMLSVRLGDEVKITVLRGGQEVELTFVFDNAKYFSEVK